MIKEGSPLEDEDHDDMALQRPMKRLKRLSNPRHAELAAHLAADLEDNVQDDTLEEEADEDFGRTATALPSTLEPASWDAQVLHLLMFLETSMCSSNSPPPLQPTMAHVIVIRA